MPRRGLTYCQGAERKIQMVRETTIYQKRRKCVSLGNGRTRRNSYYQETLQPRVHQREKGANPSGKNSYGNYFLPVRGEEKTTSEDENTGGETRKKAGTDGPVSEVDFSLAFPFRGVRQKNVMKSKKKGLGSVREPKEFGETWKGNGQSNDTFSRGLERGSFEEGREGSSGTGKITFRNGGKRDGRAL